VTFRLS